MSDEELLQFMEAEGGGVTPTTWNDADISSRLTLSNGDLTIANNDPISQFGGVRSIASSSSAKWYWETVSNALNQITGMATSASDLNTGISTGTIIYFGTGAIYDAAVLKVSGLPIGTTFTTLRMAADLTDLKFWLGDEGGWWGGGDPATGANPTYSGFAAATYFAYDALQTEFLTSTTDFGQSPAYPVPAGFTSVS